MSKAFTLGTRDKCSLPSLLEKRKQFLGDISNKYKPSHVLRNNWFTERLLYSFMFNIEPCFSCFIRRASPPPAILDPLDEEPSLADVLTLPEPTGMLEIPEGEDQRRA